MAQIMVAAAAGNFGRQESTAPGVDEDLERALDGEPDTKIKLKRPDGKPTDVYSWFEITLQDIDVPSQTFQASVEIHVFWQDYNLPNVFPDYEDGDFDIHDDCVPIKMSEIFENKVALSVVTDPAFKYYPKTGTIYMMLVVECTFVERMELQRFPLDRQFMNMEFNAMIQPTNENEGPWNWTLDYPEWMPSDKEFSERFNKPFAVRMLSSITEYELLEPWVDFSADEAPLSIRMRVNRLPAYYFGNIILPNFLIVAGCFSAFVIPRSEIADRLSVTVTLMLAAVAFKFVVSTMLPKVSYLTIMDYYLLVGFVAIMVLVAENAICGIPNFDAAKDIDVWCAALFGVFWVIIHIIALITLLRKECLRLTWEEMDAIDQAEDEEAEFMYAELDNVRGKNESEECKSDWEKYKKYDVMERAYHFSKGNGIKRSGTFHQRLNDERKSKKQMNSVKEEKEEEKDKNEFVEVYVAPKTKTDEKPKEKEPEKETYTKTEKKAVESAMADAIELAEKVHSEKDDDENDKKKEKEEEPKYDEKPKEEEAQKEPEPEPEPKQEEEEEQENDNDSADVVVVNEEDDDENDKEHGYTQTMIVNTDDKEKEKENENENNGDDYVEVTTNNSPDDEYVQ